MKAVRFVGAGRPAQLVDIPTPVPGPGEILVKIGGAGACHSDLHVLKHGRRGAPPQFTLGHENAGWVAELGSGVRGWKQGDAVAVYPVWGCGHCPACAKSAENYCINFRPEMPRIIGGLGRDGGMAEYMIVPDGRFLVRLGKLDPKAAAPLTDAALTPYHAIKSVLPALTPDTTVLMIGIGGLGHMGVQILRAVSAARLVAADINEAKLEFARKHGAVAIVNTRSENAAEEILAVSGSRKVQAVFDFVGIQSTIDLAVRVMGYDSHLAIVGLGGGVMSFSPGTAVGCVPWGCTVTAPFGGTRLDLMEAIALAEAGMIEAEKTCFSLDDAVSVYARLEKGEIQGRAVFVPDSEPRT
jgi:propanol-preferring alcohol dehydrogenase